MTFVYSLKIFINISLIHNTCDRVHSD
jgi:hypothetical protein